MYAYVSQVNFSIYVYTSHLPNPYYMSHQSYLPCDKEQRIELLRFCRWFIQSRVFPLCVITLCKVVPVLLTVRDAMQAYWGSRGIAPRIL